MKYTDKKASEIAQQWAISEATIRTWKHRGEIPDMYRATPTTMYIAQRIVQDEWIEEFEESIKQVGEDAWGEYLEYIMKTQVPADLSEAGVMARLRDKRTHLRNKY